uniref:Vacuolar protein sortingassociated protein 41 putat n=1 Tax=Albugo laibachii Nc14 TaxID=890382 RepID=F0WMR7_9STRA|nr:vacuolar protein sortingassociated protein 41 putat [Albugo laibachii Nc14]|eukprot:CCA22602.1 vacuolar protein sortingassociated protein 41 putat [Albugo laibachii Nc14]
MESKSFLEMEALPSQKTIVTSHEPILKYERLGGYLPTLLKEDAISCIAVHINYICIGTYNGNVILLQLDGTFIQRIHHHSKKVNDLHIDETGQYIASCSDDGTVAIYTLFSSFSTTSSQPTSKSSNIGEINIYNYYNAIYCVRFQEKYSFRRERIFACGGLTGQFSINRKGWILDKELTIHEGEGPIQCIQWKQELVAWANDWGVKVYNVEQEKPITFVERPQRCPPLELSRCQLIWLSETQLIVAWAHTIKIVSLDLSQSQPEITHHPKAVDNRQRKHYGAYGSKSVGKVIAIIALDYFIAGVSAWNDESLCILGYRPSREKQSDALETEFPLPEMHIIGIDGKSISSVRLPLRGHTRLRASDYKMSSLRYKIPESNRRNCQWLFDTLEDKHQEERIASAYESACGNLTYLCTPKDVVLCRVRGIKDRVQWALDRKHFRKAVYVAREDPNALQDFTYSYPNVLELYLSSLISQEKFQEAADEISRLFLGKEFNALWEKYVYIFAQRNQLSAIAKYVPTLISERLPNAQYEMILRHFLENDPEKLVQILRKLPKPKRERRNDTNDSESPYFQGKEEPLYDAHRWISELEAVIRQRRILKVDTDAISMETACVLEALAELYSSTGQYDQALRIYLTQGTLCSSKEHVFKLIGEHQLWSLVHAKVSNLVQLDTSLAIQLLVTQLEHFPILQTARQLETQEKILLEYLHQLWVEQNSIYNTEKYMELHDMQVALYVKYKLDALLHFLQGNFFIALEKVYRLCETHSPPLWEAMIYLLSRMGQEKKALELILTQLQDLQQAIHFVQSQKDARLWDYLIELSLSSSEMMQFLLEAAAADKVDPLLLLTKVPVDMELDHLKQMLIEILANYKLQSFQVDRMELMRKQLCVRKRGSHVTSIQQVCAICRQVLRAALASQTSENAQKSTLQTFFCMYECGHCFHWSCLEEHLQVWKLGTMQQTLGCLLCYQFSVSK